MENTEKAPTLNEVLLTADGFWRRLGQVLKVWLVDGSTPTNKEAA